MWICIHDTYVHWHVCGDQRIGTNVFPHCAPILTSVFLILDSLINMARCTRSHCPSLCARSDRGYTDEGDTAWIYEGGSAGRQEWGVSRQSTWSSDNDGNYVQGFEEQVGVWRSEVSTGAF